MSKVRVVLICSLFVLLVLSLIWGRSTSRYGELEIDYGLPQVWGTRTMTPGIGLILEDGTEPEPSRAYRLRSITLVGMWRVNPQNLLFDVLFWNGLIAIAAIFPTEKPNFRIPRIRITVDRPDQS